MSDAISKAIEAMDMARSAVGPFSMVVTRKLTESIDALQALQHDTARETLAAWMLARGFSTGHGDTLDDLLTELGGQIQKHSGEPVAWLFQHEDTGRTISVGLGEAEAFAKLNPRWQKVSLLYTTPQPVVDAVVFDILKAAQGSCRLGLNDIADKQIQIAIDLLSAGKETV